MVDPWLNSTIGKGPSAAGAASRVASIERVSSTVSGTSSAMAGGRKLRTVYSTVPPRVDSSAGYQISTALPSGSARVVTPTAYGPGAASSAAVTAGSAVVVVGASVGGGVSAGASVGGGSVAGGSVAGGSVAGGSAGASVAGLDSAGAAVVAADSSFESDPHDAVTMAAVRRTGSSRRIGRS